MIDSAEEFVRLRTSEVAADYERAAREEAPVTVWLDVIEKFPEMKSWVAHNKSVPIEVLDLLSTDADAEVRSVVAGRRKLSRSLFDRLAEDDDVSVRAGVAFNKKVPLELLRRLADDPAPLVREAAHVALRLRTPLAIDGQSAPDI